jgi:hypothetical protein
MGLAILGTVAITITLVAKGAPVPPVLGVCLVVLLLTMAIFGSLTVAVSDERVRLWFGPGLIRKSFGVRDIQDAAIVRNRWVLRLGNPPHAARLAVQRRGARRGRVATGERPHVSHRHR